MPLKLNSKELKSKFINYFTNKDHTEVPSSSVVPFNDPSLLFVNSGMVQFKNNLLGIENDFSNLKKATSSQRCIRAGGKHNDLDDVGKDTYHHTFFEMLGNWSFGDYFKEKAIFYAYDFLVNVLKLNKDQIYVTYFSDNNVDLPEDKETFCIWQKYLPDTKIIKGSFRDNFWEMAETGPCGPCTEIHYDRIGNRDASLLVNKDDPNVLEVWNVVFMEYNRTKDSFLKLNKQCVDTGIGFERLLSIVNEVNSNYLTDLFIPLFKLIESQINIEYKDTLNQTDTAFRILADHSRTIAVCLHDKVNYSNEGRGYVLRRITRRALRFATEILNLKENFLCELVNLAGNLLNLKIDVTKVKEEEILFSKTLKRGTQLFYKMIQNEEIKNKKEISGKDAFILYDTYGFPLDLTKILAQENGIIINEEEFEKEKELAKERSKSTKEIVLPQEFVVDDSFKYSTNKIKAKLLYYSEGMCVFDKTCFYAELGGQVGDTGLIIFLEDISLSNENNTSNNHNEKEIGVFEVTNTKLINKTVVHFGNLTGKISNKGILSYNIERREKIRKNHKATHLLNYFLRKNICNTIKQKGSLVSDDKLRFDFEFNRSLSDEEINNLEKSVNSVIKAKKEVITHQINFSEINNEEIITLEGEQYPSKVRNVCINNIQELCGGTHVSNTEEIEVFKIFYEGSISTNTRRIVAKTGEEALKDFSLLQKKEKEKEEKMKIKSELSKFKQELTKEVKELELLLISHSVLPNDKSFFYESKLNLQKDSQKHLSKLIQLYKKYNIKGLVYYFDGNKVFFNGYKFDCNELRNVCDEVFFKEVNDCFIGYCITNINDFNEWIKKKDN